MSKQFSKVSVIGLGYIGLPTAAIFAREGIEVIGVDINQVTVDTINKGEIHIVEPGLKEVVRHTVAENKLRATTQPEAADAFVIAVPTPFTDNRDGDLTYIKAAAKAIAPVLQAGNLIVLESTSPVGTTEKMEQWLAAARPDLKFPKSHGDDADIFVAYCPERVLPGKVMDELVQNDRIVGGLSKASSDLAGDLYAIFLKGNCLKTNARTAEMAKLTENSFRDVNIAFANELSLVCDELGINVWELIRLANRHPRVNILQPGPGVGGHCIAVDPWFIVSSAPDTAKLIRTAREVNDSKPLWVIRRVLETLSRVAKEKQKPVSELTVTCLGLSFKPNIDDLRESPAVAIAKEIAAQHTGKTFVVEPHIKAEQNPIKDSDLVEIDVGLKNGDVAVLLVDHDEFKAISRGEIDHLAWIDTRGLMDY
ncbi:UDP-N-acetyl-D-mannosamine dehydrogenase [Pseudidiomarina halophila]|uniref:UDP-N-acetyl-D-mannosamine dehydrogenase n=1 Tax=Pseudidiomarina halophila TaxID=1449799 RepID=A0A432XWR0_9GAMM|nr:UDP-N-acetyl-D-mannosamine dehydrogenase [Pseudidiomarina halophila]RUO53166.1 UDP-N-acetyl-D-mannosamine dehydrogenase [Pseudidiomarina halophila]